MKRMTTTVVLLGLLTILAAPAMGDDLLPPSWRGRPGSTIQGWEFQDATMPDYPDWGEAVSHSGQTLPVLPSTVLTVDPGPGMEWMQQYEGGDGVWPLSGIIDVLVDNFQEPNPKKYLWVQLTWAPMGVGWPNPIPDITNIFPPPVPPVANKIQEGPLDPLDPNSVWMHTVWAWELYENPLDEFFIVEGDIFVDELVVDTWCTAEIIPEPGTMAMLAGAGLLGLIVMVRRRNKR